MSKAFTHIAHAFIGEYYLDSYPLLTGSARDAKRVFKSIGYVDTPNFKISVDSVVDFIHNAGTFTMEDFQQHTGLDIVTWIWGPNEYDWPRYVLDELDRLPESRYPAPAIIYTHDDWIRMQKESMTLWKAIKRSVMRRKGEIKTLVSKMVGTGLRIKGHGPEDKTILRWVIAVYNEEDSPYGKT